MLKTALKKVTEGRNLTTQEAGNLIEFISEGKALSSEIAAFLTALKMKGETPDEITGFALKMRELAPKVNTQGIDNVVDSCGTGGDGANTFNISTASAILAASSGLHIAKHSNFGFTSKSGSSNVLESLGIKLVKTPEEVRNNLLKYNIAFIHAPYFHKCTAHVNEVRKEIGIRTVFNFLGPLTNPAKPTAQVLGVACPKLCPKIAETLNNLGCKKAMVVNAQNPVMDEISTCGETLVYKLENGKIESFYLHPRDFNIPTAKIEEISGDTPDVNAKIIKGIFGKEIQRAKLNIVLLNTAAILWAGNKAESIENGIKLAESLINSGKALEKLSELT